MGKCDRCGEKTKNTCKGCKKPKFICEKCSLDCFWCNDKGPYCGNCSHCQNGKNCGPPGNHSCDGCGIFMKNRDFHTMCAICDEMFYCKECSILCQCGIGDSHYLCTEKFGKRKYSKHTCLGEDCSLPLCNNAKVDCFCGTNQEETLFCSSHRPTISVSLRMEILNQIKNDPQLRAETLHFLSN